MANERLTEFHLIYDMSDITALADSTPTTTFNKDFADIELLKEMGTTPGQMTLERNYCALDGSQEEFDDIPASIAFFTDEMSDEEGEFENNPVIDITFTEFHSSYALTLSFIDDFPLELTCSWYQDEARVFYRTYEVDSNEFVIDQAVQNYNHIVIEFTKALPHRYIKLNYIRYGVIIHWSESDVKKATLVQSTDRISKQLSINTLNFEVVDPEDETNPGNKKGLHNYFQKTQIMYPYELINGERVELGRYYLENFTYQNNLCKINAVSRIGLMETVQYDRGTIYNGIAAGTVIADIFDVLGMEDYTVDEVTAAQLLYGTLAPMSCKDALQKILFACHSVIDTSDMENIKIYKSTEVIAGDIKRGNKWSTSVKRIDYVSAVQINYETYRLGSDVSEIENNKYEPGQHKVIFAQPHDDYSITGGVIDETAPYYVVFTVTNNVETDVVISGKGYDVLQNKVVVDRPYKEAGEGENIKEFSTTLCNVGTAKVLAEKLLKYYENRLEISIQYLATDAVMNQRRTIENSTPGMEDYIGIFTDRTLDLTGGFIDNAKFIGYFDTADYYFFLTDDGNELIADNNAITGW